ncbi:phosphotransferase [Alienimonas chondri]|uniref:Aminoglycoside phosphotransferase domain-containing protein n=1 Tax=Alienimonas chondri TaxID=2681879 RepID=A0ABX1VH34_9PLAN|nr:phosphotransferase [Alienimonas chondri]NNJ27153.1 hypothetical protein [Alienimonas chondri]
MSHRPPAAAPDRLAHSRTVADPVTGIAPLVDRAAAAFDPVPLFGTEYRRTGPLTAVDGGFSGAGVTRIPTAAGTFALRIWPEKPPPRARLRGLHALLAHVRRVAPHVPIAAPVPTLGGETLFTHGKRLAQLEPWLPGEPLPTAPTGSQLKAAAEALARFHDAAESFVPAPAARPFFAATAGGRPRSVWDRWDRLRRWLESEGRRASEILRDEPASEFKEQGHRLLRTLELCGESLERRLSMACQAIPLFPVLLDVHREHVLLSGGRVTGLIDPAAARVDTPAADLARLAVSLEPGRLPALIAAYRTSRPLFEEEERLAVLLHDSGALLSGLAWVARGTWEQRPGARDPAALARLTHFADVAERLEAA